MAWSWSHAGEAYAAAWKNLEGMERETLEVIFAEWESAKNDSGEIEDYNDFDQEKYTLALDRAKKLPGDILVDHIWEHAENASTCDNGGYLLWMCPYGCMAHKASPDIEETEDDF